MKIFFIALLTLIALTSAQDYNCKVKYSDETCQACSFGFHIGPDGICVLLPEEANCATYHMRSDQGVCIDCWSRQYVDNSTQYCVDVSGSCNDFDISNGKCKTCWWGEPTDGVCP